MNDPRRTSIAVLSFISVLCTCLPVHAGQQASAPAGPQIKLLAMPQAELKPAVEFLAKEPVIDGRLDRELQGSAARPFAVLVKMNPANPETKAGYRLAYGSDFLYLFIDVEADRLICRDRGYQNGDGFILVLNKPRPGNAASDELFMLGYHPTGKPERPFAQMVWKRNDDWPFSPLSERSAFRVNAEAGHLGFEALLRWTDVHPYHPWLGEGIGFNLILCKAYGETDLNYLAVSAKPVAGMEAFNAYSRLAFAPPVSAERIQFSAVLEKGHLSAGEQLRVKLAAVSAKSSRLPIELSFWAGEGKRVAGKSFDLDLEAGVSRREAELDTSGLAGGNYTVRWEASQNAGSGQAGLTILPVFDEAAKDEECDAAGARVSSGSLQTMRYLLSEIMQEKARLKPSETCPGLLLKMERADLLLGAAATGDDQLAKQKGILRRAFSSKADNTLQPYTVLVPAVLETGKTYPAVVFLHGSDSDDQSVRSMIQRYPFMFLDQGFVIAPFGRGPSNGFSRDHAQDDIREAVADALRQYPIDPGRLVLAGFSMGGYGVFRTLYENPKMYRAGVSFSGQTDIAGSYGGKESHPDFRKPEFVKPLGGLNIAVIHGGRDRNCPVERAAEMVELMKQNGIPVRFWLDREAGHEPPRDPAVIAEYRSWLKTAVVKNPGPAERIAPRAPLELTYIANCGALVSAGDSKVLFDALFDKPNPEYRAPAPDVLDKIIKGKAPFDGVDLVLVTHNHPDHFDAGVAVRYLEARPEPILLAPADAVEAMRKAAADWEKIGPRVISVGLRVGEKATRTVKGLMVTSLRTLHSGDRESPMNLMYLVEMGGSSVWHEGDSNGKPEVYQGFGLGRAPVDLALVHYWFPLEPNCAKFLQEVLKPDHIALTHLPVKLESDAPGKIDSVRQYYKDIFLLLPGMPTKSVKSENPAERDLFFGQIPPGMEPVKFLPEILTSEKHPHGQLAFSPDGTGVYWSAMLKDGPEQTIFYSAFDGKALSRPAVAPFAAASGNGGPAFSSDGRRLFFNAELPPAGGSSAAPFAICYVERIGSGWGRPTPIESTIDTRMTKGQVSVARSGNIYFSGRVLSERTPGIYVCRYSNGTYLAPEKLTGPVATVPLLIDPWVDPDEKFLLVSCPPAEGTPMRPDIGISYRQADGTWSQPVRLGGFVNTQAFERFPSLSRDGKYLFFIRSASEQFVGDQAHFYWVDASVLSELINKARDSKAD